MAKPPAGSSLLFGALVDSGRIKQRKNGSYRMVLKGVDEIDWFTDRPNRVAGEWSPKQLVKKWDGLFGDGDGPPNAQATFEVGNKRKLVTFEMFKPKLSNSNQTISFKVRGIGASNKDDLTGLAGKEMSEVSLFIDNAYNNYECSATANALNNFVSGAWGSAFGPQSATFTNAKGSNYAFVSLYENEETQPFTPSQQYKMVQSSLQYVADQATSDDNNDVALQDQYVNINSDELSSLLLSGVDAYRDIFTGILTSSGEANPLTQTSYADYLTIANQASLFDCFDSNG
ncbi:hypothetical protein [Synechococcus sp. PROS-U-1]|uniref:hypothetical protein n=1 Tax=Synechococcus sp. PROS-U-1 TaxID=1400866 RepID=UPI0016446CB6|nr:hypothetical protein [Synechococcus sp. PROS-U-1]QNJ03634.1 pentapeptide repeats family protein [Synechococcus sp. PROS-U-1]